MAQQIQIRRDTSTNWTATNPTLAQGEFGFETNTFLLKIGDGATAWNSLSYFSPGGGGGGLTGYSLSADGTFAVNSKNVNVKSGLLIMALPASSAVTDEIHLVGYGAGGWKISQASGQQINYNATQSTLGATGFVSSSNRYDCVSIICVVANTIWTVLGGTGVANVN